MCLNGKKFKQIPMSFLDKSEKSNPFRLGRSKRGRLIYYRDLLECFWLL